MLKQYTARINRILKYIQTKDITEMNNLLLAAGIANKSRREKE